MKELGNLQFQTVPTTSTRGLLRCIGPLFGGLGTPRTVPRVDTTAKKGFGSTAPVTGPVAPTGTQTSAHSTSARFNTHKATHIWFSPQAERQERTTKKGSRAKHEGCPYMYLAATQMMAFGDDLSPCDPWFPLHVHH